MLRPGRKLWDGTRALRGVGSGCAAVADSRTGRRSGGCHVPGGWVLLSDSSGAIVRCSGSPPCRNSGRATGSVVSMSRVIPMRELFRACYKMGWLVCLGVVRDSWGVLGSFVALHGVGSCSVQRVAHGVVCSFSFCCCFVFFFFVFFFFFFCSIYP